MWSVFALCTVLRSLNVLYVCVQAKNIKNKPIVNRDEQYIRVEAMQTELLVSHALEFLYWESLIWEHNSCI